jgi:predicted porin
MRKTQLALAAVALVASSAALADGVKIYGTVDGAVANTSVTGGDGLGTYLSGAGGYSYGNNIGFKGSEDLGNGLKADFQLETGFQLGDGATNNGGSTAGFFNRVSTLGLSGDFGSVKLGQQLSPYIGAALGSILSNGHFGVNRLILGGAAAYGSLDGNTAFPYGGFFIPNAISYTSPSISGFSASVLTSFKSGSQGGSAPTPVATERYTSASLSGAVGDINLAIGYEERAQNFKNWVAGASANLGDAQVALNYMNVKITGMEAMGSYALGVGYNLTPALNVNLQYARNSDTPGANAPALTALTGKYTLSKSTSAYASYLHAKDGAISTYDGRASGVAPSITGVDAAPTNKTIVVGIAHSF